MFPLVIKVKNVFNFICLFPQEEVVFMNFILIDVGQEICCQVLHFMHFYDEKTSVEYSFFGKKENKTRNLFKWSEQIIEPSDFLRFKNFQLKQICKLYTSWLSICYSVKEYVMISLQIWISKFLPPTILYTHLMKPVDTKQFSSCF